MRRLAVFLASTLLLQGLIFSALSPLLPTFEEELNLSKGQAGLLVGMFPIGQAVMAIPMGMLAARLGLKRFALAALVVFAVSTVAFGFAHSFWQLATARLVQGFGAGICLPTGLAWGVTVAPLQRRAEMIGVITGGAAAGQMLGPTVGGLAVVTGRAALFSGAAALYLALALVGTRFADPGRSPRQSARVMLRVHRSRPILLGLWLAALPSFGLGVVFVLAPLQLHRLGWGAFGIAVTFLVMAGVGSLLRPLVGRWSDRGGMLAAISVLIALPVPFVVLVPWLGSALGVAGCVVCVCAIWGALFGPTAALLSHRYEASGIAHVVGFALTSMIAAIGISLGSAAGGALAKAAGDETVYLVVAAVSAGTVLGIRMRKRPETVAAGAPVPVD